MYIFLDDKPEASEYNQITQLHTLEMFFFTSVRALNTRFKTFFNRIQQSLSRVH